MNESYQLHYDGENQGPYTMGQIGKMWAAGLITADALLWDEAQDAWRPLVDLMAGGSFAPQPAPPVEPMPALPLPMEPDARWQGAASNKEASRSGVSGGASMPGRSAALDAFEQFARPSASVQSAASHLSGRAGPPELPAAAASLDVRLTKPRPWRRLYARMTDYTLVAFPFWLLLWLTRPESYGFFADGKVGYVAMNLILGVPIFILLMILEPLCLSRFGTTPGKWLFGLSVRKKDGSALSFGNAFVRFLRLIPYAYIPVFDIVTAIIAYNRLRRTGATSWDEKGGYVVSCHGKFRWVLFIGIYLLYAMVKSPFVHNANNSQIMVPEKTAAPDAFKDITNEEFGMGFSMPGDPALETQTVNTPMGSLVIHIYSLEVGTSGLHLSFSVFPDEHAIGDPKEESENGRDGVLSNIHGRVTSQKEISLDGNPGLEFQFDSDTYRGSYRIYLVGHRVYQIGSLSPTGTPLLPDTERFFASFHLLKP